MNTKYKIKSFLICINAIIGIICLIILVNNFLDVHAYNTTKELYKKVSNEAKECFKQSEIEKRDLNTLDNFKPIFEENVTITNISFQEVKYLPKCSEEVKPIKISAILIETLNDNQEKLQLMVKPSSKIDVKQLSSEKLMVLQKDNNDNYLAITLKGEKILLVSPNEVKD